MTSKSETKEPKEPRPPARRWLKMGAELEGGWDSDPNRVVANIRGAKVQHDGSIRVRANFVAELTTRPHETLDKLCEDIKALYPNHVDISCGFHLHASFSVMDHSALTSPEFWEYFRARWKAWGEEHAADIPTYFWDRWKGVNPGGRQYCKAEFIPSEQLRRPEQQDLRYTQLNFHAWHKYKTFECRLLPMFSKVDLAIDAVRNLSDIYDTWLNDYRFAPIVLDETISGDETGMAEVYQDKIPDLAYKEDVITSVLPRLATGPDLHYHFTGAEHLMLPFVKETDDGEP